jgi:hypothetical protein
MPRYLEDIYDDYQLLDDLFEERAAILEYDGGLSRYQAEQKAAQVYGFKNKDDLKQRVQKLKASK